MALSTRPLTREADKLVFEFPRGKKVEEDGKAAFAECERDATCVTSEAGSEDLLPTTRHRRVVAAHLRRSLTSLLRESINRLATRIVVHQPQRRAHLTPSRPHIVSEPIQSSRFLPHAVPMAETYKIDVHCVPKEPDQPSPSGFCQKLETVFRASGFTDYQLKFSYPHQGPKGKVPWIVLHTSSITLSDGSQSKAGSETIADSHFITQHLVKQGIIPDLDAGLTASQKADSRAWQAYTEELNYTAIVWTRWFIPSNFQIMRRVFSSVPIPIRWILEWFIYGRVKAATYAAGVGRHSKEEIISIMERWVGDLRDHFVEKDTPWFHGDKPTYIDCVLYGMLANVLGQECNPEITAMILSGNGVGKDKGGEVLRDYVKRGTKLWFPEYEQILRVVQ